MPCCNKGIFIIKKYKNPHIINIFYCQCNNKTCRKEVQLRNYSILKICKNISPSVFFKIIECFFLHEKNVAKISELIKEKFKKTISVKKKQKYYIKYK